MKLLVILVLIATVGTGQEVFEQRENASRKNWYERQYAALQEQSLDKIAPTASNLERYRFTWLRTFHHPVVIRLEIDGPRAQVFVKETDGAGGYDPGKLIHDFHLDLTPSEIDDFRKALVESRFWFEPWYEKTDQIGSDGAQWIFDGCVRDACHVVDRWSPRKRKPFAKLGALFLRLSKLKIPDNEVY